MKKYMLCFFSMLFVFCMSSLSADSMHLNKKIHSVQGDSQMHNVFVTLEDGTQWKIFDTTVSKSNAFQWLADDVVQVFVNKGESWWEAPQFRLNNTSLTENNTADATYSGVVPSIKTPNPFHIGYVDSYDRVLYAKLSNGFSIGFTSYSSLVNWKTYDQVFFGYVNAATNSAAENYPYFILNGHTKSVVFIKLR